MISGMAARVTRRTGLGMLAAIVLAATAILSAAAQNARGNSGWSDWQNLGRLFSNPVAGEEAFRLSAAEFINGNPVIVTIDRTGKWGHPTSGWKLLTELRVVKRRSHLLELFTLDQQGTLWTTYQQ